MTDRLAALRRLKGEELAANISHDRWHDSIDHGEVVCIASLQINTGPPDMASGFDKYQNRSCCGYGECGSFCSLAPSSAW